MKLKTKNNIGALLLSVGCGVGAWFLYLLGKMDGKDEALTAVATECEKLLKESMNTEN